MARGRARVPVCESVKLRAYPVVLDYVERGVRYGLNRAYKHIYSPTREQLETALVDAVINSLCEVLVFDDEAGR